MMVEVMMVVTVIRCEDRREGRAGKGRAEQGGVIAEDVHVLLPSLLWL